MPSCSVVFCSNRSQTKNYNNCKITYHLFPKDAKIKEKWINATGRPPTWFPTKTSTICSEHFTPDMFQPLKKRRRLFEWAVPTLQLRVIYASPSRESNLSSDHVDPIKEFGNGSPERLSLDIQGKKEATQKPQKHALPRPECFVEVDLLEIKEERIENMPGEDMETDTSHEDTQTSGRIASTEVFQEPLPIKLEVFDETEKDNSAVPFITSITAGTELVNAPLRVKLEVFDETETDRSDSSALPFTTSMPSGSSSATNMPGCQVSNPLAAIPGVAGMAEEVELWTLDEYDKFGLSIAKSMKTLSDVEQRIKLIAAVENLVAEYVTKDVKKTFPNTSFASEASQASSSFDPAYATFAFQNKDNSYTLVCKRKAKSQNK